MKTTFSIFLAAIAMWVVASYTPSTASLMDKPTPGSVQKRWATVDSLKKAGQPKSALELVENILVESRKTKDQPSMVKAIIYKIALRSEYEENFLENSINELENEIARADMPSFSVLHSVQGELYHRYFNQNRYNMLERTAMAGEPGKDIKTWDARTLLRKASFHYQQSLKDGDDLKKTPVSDFAEVMDLKEDSKRYRPTLFDLLAHRAIEFYSQQEPYSMPAKKPFEANKQVYFGVARQFADLVFDQPDSESYLFHTLEILRQLTGFHLNRKEPFALVDVELKRLSVVRQFSSLAGKDELYLQALELLSTTYKNEAVLPEIVHAIATELTTRGNAYDPVTNPETRLSLKEARQRLEAVIQQFPEEPATKNCRILLEQLMTPALNIETEYVNLPNKDFKVLITYRNLPEVFFTLIKMDPDEDRALKERNLQNKELLAAYAAISPTMKWSQPLPDDGDLQQHRVEVMVKSLPEGYYVILASNGSKIPVSIKGNDPEPTREILAHQSFWCSSLAFVSRDLPDGSVAFVVLHRETGNPLQNVKATIFRQQYNQANRAYVLIKGQTFVTDKEGVFMVPPSESRVKHNSYIVDFKNKSDRFITENYFYQYRYDDGVKTKRTQTFLFTDRSLYRPGQTVYFKGIVIETDGEKNEIRKNFKSVIALHNTNYEKVSEKAVTTNEFGSFAGSFVLPTSGLTGSFQIVTPHGSMGITVEEYRLPKFEVLFDTIRESYKLGEKITITGVAKAYAGNPIMGADVSFRITRQANFPFWRYSFRPYFPLSPAAEILNGTVQTDGEGRFSITFEATPDLQISSKNLPVFNFILTADVTDIQGETQSGTTAIAVGYKALLLQTDFAEKIAQDDFKGFVIKANNLNGQAVEANGDIIVSRLKQPENIIRDRKWAQPDRFIMDESTHRRLFPFDPYADDANPETWAVEKQVFSGIFNTASGNPILPMDFRSWQTGVYRLVLKTTDAFGEMVEYTKQFTIFNPNDKRIPVQEFWWATVLNGKAKPGEKVRILIGTAAKINVLMEVEVKGKVVDSKRINLCKRARLIEIPVTKEHLGDFSIRFTGVMMNRAFVENFTIVVPQTDKELEIRFETMRSKLEPGTDETWNFNIVNDEGKPMNAELLAGMYDASLDALLPHAWMFNLPMPSLRRTDWSVHHAFSTRSSSYFFSPLQANVSPYYREYDRLNWFGFESYGHWRYRYDMTGGAYPMKSGALALEERNEMMSLPEAVNGLLIVEDQQEIHIEEKSHPKPGSTIRRDFRETAFFYPQLITDEKGAVKLQFKLPESFTRWKFMGLAHTNDLKTGALIREFESSREVMIVSNAPRFFRQGDAVVYQAKVVNTTDKNITASVMLELFDAVTMQPIEALYGLDITQKSIEIPANGAKEISWDLNIPSTGTFAVICRTKATSGNHSDGEEIMIPVLTNRQLITESMPMFVNAGETRSFTLAKLLETGKPGTTSTNHKLTLEFTTNPVWYAVQALPYLAEPNYRSADALFHRFYANRLASHIINSNPEIERVFKIWLMTQPDALLSNLEKNQDLKNIVVDETPWLLDARKESENKRSIALMFDRSKIEQEIAQSIKELLQMQLDNGGWPWMQGMPDNQYITRQIVAGFGRLRSLGAMDFTGQPDLSGRLQRAVYYLDDRMQEEMQRMNIKDGNKYLNHGAIHYLWARTYFTNDYPLREKHAQMFGFWTDQAGKYWLEQPIYMQGMIAIALHRSGNTVVAQQILRSLKNKSLFSSEMGMYWRDLQSGYYWYQAPVEAQALLIEAFSVVADDAQSVQKMQQWLVKQKQTQSWKTNRATAEAIFAILMRGETSLAQNKGLSITVGNKIIDPAKDPTISAEAGSGYFRISWNPGDITPDMAKVTVKNDGKTIGWGGMYWQYFEQLDRITYHETPLKLNRKMFLESLTPSGPVLEEITTKSLLQVGDKMIMRIELRADRDMEFVHMKDLRAPAFEPINQLSQYKYQDGLGYYENPRDAATHFFFQYLPKGTYVFEYRVFVTQTGDFSSGITVIQCLYAPEFTAHSEGIRISVMKQ